jgi:hypothetical protein
MKSAPASPSVARWSSVIALAVAFAACSSGPTSVTLPPLQVIVASGDSQYGTVNQTLTEPLQVHVETVTTELPQKGVNVVWTVERGDAAIVGVATTVTDSTGAARVGVRLGASTGQVTVRAAIQGQARASAEFRLFTVERPALDAIAPTAADPGSSVTLTGVNFSPDPDQNVVLFGGVRGRVTMATTTQIVVTVPTCLPERQVGVTVQLGAVGSDPLSLAIGPGGEVLDLAIGEVFDAVDEGGFTCATVPGDLASAYLVAVHSVSAVGAASHPYRLNGLSAGGPLLAAAGRGRVPPSELVSRTDPGLGRVPPTAAEAWSWFARGLPVVSGEPPDPQALWDRYLREREAELTRARGSTGSAEVAPADPGPSLLDGPARVPMLNETRTFQVFSSTGGFTQVTAVARHIGAHAALFVDENAPDGGYTAADLQYLSALFDDLIHPTVVGEFGNASDLDQNDRIVILFTPAVNALTPRGATGFVGGFFYGVDLLPDATGSNRGEIFYALVPDPAGVHSDPRPKDALLDLTPAILAHEFQHMVHFNERVLVRGAEANEAIWLSEALAQYAEELAARAAEANGAPADEVEIFRAGTRARARRWLARPDTVSVVISAGSGNLPERGAGFLYLVYLADRFGDALAGDLTRTTRTGVTNLEAETGTEWGALLSDWWSAVWLDGPDPESGPLVYPRFDLRGFVKDPFPLQPVDPGGGDFARSGSLRSSAVAYYIVDPPVGGSTTLRLGGDGGGASAPQARMRMRIIRVE